jgi:hypothetical protein
LYFSCEFLYARRNFILASTKRLLDSCHLFGQKTNLCATLIHDHVDRSSRLNGFFGINDLFLIDVLDLDPCIALRYAEYHSLESLLIVLVDDADHLIEAQLLDMEVLLNANRLLVVQEI